MLPRAPFEADPLHPDHWVAGGRYAWDNGGKGWKTSCGATACDWQIVGDSGAGNSITQIAIHNGVGYAAWCGPCNGTSFNRGIPTNAGSTDGKWHQLTLPTDGSFPTRFIQGIAIDPANTNHVYVVFNGFSRRWTNENPAGIGHVYESTDAGAHWTNISGNLPDIPADDIVVAPGGKLVVATDVGVVISTDDGKTLATARHAAECLGQRPAADRRRQEDPRGHARPRPLADLDA